MVASLGIFCLVLFTGCACSKAKTVSRETASGLITVTLPKPGDTITNERAIELCRYYDFDYLADRITTNPDRYKSWKFDGVSMAPDGLFSWMFGIPNATEIALRHDLKYAYGEKGNKAEKKGVDIAFKQELIDDGCAKWVAGIMFKLVNKFGKEKYDLSFSWGFTHK